MSRRRADGIADPASGVDPYPDWLRLDNSAKIWPALLSPRHSTMFRLTACLLEPVRLSVLEDALSDLLDRFPYFHVQLRRGLFWYYLETHRAAEPSVEADSVNPCMNADLIGKGHMPVRVRAFNTRISVEFSHMVTDGTGALTFLRALVNRYCELSGVPCSPMEGLPRAGEPVDPREWEDSYLDAIVDSTSGLPRIPAPENSFRIPSTLLPAGTYRVISGLLSARAVVALAKGHGISLTEYVGAVLLWCLQDIQERRVATQGRWEKVRPIRLTVPVNLRPMFDSRTLRNFFLFVDPGIDPRLGRYTFDEIADQVHHQMRFNLQKKRMRHLITRNVRGEQSVLNRLMPAFVKDAVLQVVFHFLGDRRYSMGLSNLGRVQMPVELDDLLSHWVFVPPPSPVSKVNCAMLSWQDTLCVSFGSMARGAELEKEFFRFFSSQGLQVYIESNAEWCEHGTGAR